MELWDFDNIVDQHLGSTETDESGHFSFDAVSNSDDWGSGTQDIYFKFFPRNEAASIRSEPPVYVPEYIISPTQYDIPCVSFDTLVWLAPSAETSGMFFVVDALLEGYRKWLVGSATGVPDDCWVRFENGGVTHYDPGVLFGTMHIDTSDNPSTFAPDTWDRDVILHEHGHFVEDEFDFFEDGGGTHYVDSTYTPGLAASEGFASFWAAVVTGSPILTNYSFGFYLASSINLENGELGYIPSSTLRYVNAYGMLNEIAAGGVLWDIYDDDADDYSSKKDWGVKDTPHTPDVFFGDLLSNGLVNILRVLQDDTPQTMDEFYADRLAEFDSLHYRELTHIGYEHGKPCCGTVGDVTGDGELNADDAYRMASFMFQDGPSPTCPDEWDVNGSWIPQSADPSPLPDIADIIYLVTFMFQEGPPPAPCP